VRHEQNELTEELTGRETRSRFCYGCVSTMDALERIIFTNAKIAIVELRFSFQW
jgi:hypothetical protein